MTGSSSVNSVGDSAPAWSLGQLAALACTAEVCAPKPGNVHRAADFEDVTAGDFLISGLAIVPVFDRCSDLTVGQIIRRGIESTRAIISSNTNLGILLLLAPLAKASTLGGGLSDSIAETLKGLTEEDAADVYAAIQLAQPGGMGKVEQQDVSGPPPTDLLAAMKLAEDRDRVARQYTHSFTDVLDIIEPDLVAHIQSGMSWSQAIVHSYVECLARWPDSLIVRKVGEEVALQCQAHAGAVLRAGRPGEDNYHEALADLDFWLRADGNRRNPGTTADLICAGVFAGLIQGNLSPGPWN